LDTLSGEAMAVSTPAAAVPEPARRESEATMAHTPPGRTREQVWRFVRDRLLAGDPPTVREVQEAFGFRAVESARAHLAALVAEGRLEQDPGRARGWRLPSDGGPGAYGAGVPVMVPVLGRVQAGALTTALEEPEGMVAVMRRTGPASRRPRTPRRRGAATPSSPADDLFALHVRGDSMRDAGILDGDLVVVRRQETAADGEIVVALVGDEATVKRLRIAGRRSEPAAPRETGARSESRLQAGLPPAGPTANNPAEAGTPNEPQPVA
jgi:repressor LexA